MALDDRLSALAQVQQMTVEHSTAVWADALDPGARGSGPGSELATMLLAVNYELMGYPPAEAWMLARRGESAAPGRLDG